MPIINRMADLHLEITNWRRQLHANPELQYNVQETAAMVADKLGKFGCDNIVTGIGRTGVVGVITGKSNLSGRVIGLRADMDALPITEQTGKPYASKNSGKMHACGHDGHTSMLLGAAQYLTQTRNFDGTVVVIFQPAEEGGAGGKAMLEDGLMDRFGIDEIYGLHNLPGLDVGRFAIRPGPITASTDEFAITITGHGGHAAMPHDTVDPIVITAHVLIGLQSIVSRSIKAVDSVVITTTKINAGTANNVIPNKAVMSGTVRSLSAEGRKTAIRLIPQVAEGIASGFGASAKVCIATGYPITHNHERQTAKAVAVAKAVAGEGMVEDDCEPMLGGEDFAYMLEKRPGAYIFMGNGDTANLHNAEYDFNDEATPFGCSYWAKLAETLLPVTDS